MDAETTSKIEKLVATANGSESFPAADATERHTKLEAWQVKEIKRALKEADAGKFASAKDLAKAIKKYAN